MTLPAPAAPALSAEQMVHRVYAINDAAGEQIALVFGDTSDIAKSRANQILAALAAPALSADLEEAIRLCEVGEYLYSARAYSYGDGYTEPREYGIDWQWQQSKPGEYGQGVLLAEAVKWHEAQAADGFVTEAAKLRAALAAPAPAEVGEDLALALDGAFRAGWAASLAVPDPRAPKLAGAMAAGWVRAELSDPRPSRDAGGEAVDPNLLAKIDDRIAWEKTGYDHDLFVEIRAALNAHPPAPAAENGRVAELEAALRKIAEWPYGGNTAGQEQIMRFARAALVESAS
jgi:hypothetical protein